MTCEEISLIYKALSIIIKQSHIRNMEHLRKFSITKMSPMIKKTFPSSLDTFYQRSNRKFYNK